MKLAALVACLAILTTSAVAAPGFRNYERVTAELMAQNARLMLDQRLNDLPSARFQGVYAAITKLKDPVFGADYDAYIICGQVNAKNRMGGYVGWREFAVVRNNGPIGTPSVYFEDEVGGAILLPRYCQPNEGLPLRFDQSASYTDLVSGKTKLVN